jgi:hypothetical protein
MYGQDLMLPLWLVVRIRGRERPVRIRAVAEAKARYLPGLVLDEGNVSLPISILCSAVSCSFGLSSGSRDAIVAPHG